ncbi:hypothetical protein DMUE_0490 [Dictyocoela muelleri]|nr:hypothetical protein DMUE_0490 [Dictyocoela muelleri]
MVNVENKISRLHELLVHPGYFMMKETLREIIDIDNFKAVIKRICERCITCQVEKVTNSKTGKINTWERIPKLHDQVSIDLKGPTKTRQFISSRKEKYFFIMVICEFVSRYSEIIVPFDLSSSSVMKNLLKVGYRFINLRNTV